MESYGRKSLFKLGKFNKFHLFLFIFSPFSLYLNTIFLNYIKNNNQWAKTSSVNYFSIYFGYTLIGGILFLYYLIINKEEKEVKETNMVFFTIKKKSSKNGFMSFLLNKKNKIIISFLLIIITDCISTFIFTFFQKFPNFTKFLGYLYPLEIISFIVLSNFLLKLKISEHQLFSLFIIIIGLFIINIINFTQIDLNKKNLFLIIGLLILQYLYPLLDIIVYNLLYEKEFNFSLFCFLIGILGIAIGIILSLFSEILSTNKLYINIFEDISNIKSSFSIFLIMSISNGITYCILYSIFKLFKPWFFGITAVMNGLFNCIHSIIVNLFEKQFNIILITQFFIYIILIFACLIFNEQIICNFWGLNKNTKIEIISRATEEIEMCEIKNQN